VRFDTWLRKQKKRDDPIGDLAKDVRADGWRGRTPVALRVHLQERHPDAVDGAYESLNRAADEYFAFLSEHREWTPEIVQDLIDHAEFYRGIIDGKLIDAVIARRDAARP